MSSEAQRVTERYARRAPGQYGVFRPEVWLWMQERQRALIGLLKNHAPKPLAELSVLEIGCGEGGNLLELVEIGFSAANLTGNELLPEKAAVSRANLPAASHFIAGDALAIEGQGRFDIVYQSTVFTSLLDADFQQRLAARMWELVAPGGGVLWYDFTFNNPCNPDVRGVSVRRIRELFPDAKIDVRQVTLAPPISRRVARIHPLAYHALNAIPWLRTHVMCWIGKH